jgi:hypothetical protein
MKRVIDKASRATVAEAVARLIAEVQAPAIKLSIAASAPLRSGRTIAGRASGQHMLVAATSVWRLPAPR